MVLLLVVCGLKTVFAGKFPYDLYGNFPSENGPGSGFSRALFVKWSLLLHTREVLCLAHLLMMQEISGCSQDKDSIRISLFCLCCATCKIWTTAFPVFACFNLVLLDSNFFDFRGGVLIYTIRKSALEMLLTRSPSQEHAKFP